MCRAVGGRGDEGWPVRAAALREDGDVFGAQTTVKSAGPFQIVSAELLLELTSFNDDHFTYRPNYVGQIEDNRQFFVCPSLTLVYFGDNSVFLFLSLCACRQHRVGP